MAQRPHRPSAVVLTRHLREPAVGSVPSSREQPVHAGHRFPPVSRFHPGPRPDSDAVSSSISPPCPAVWPSLVCPRLVGRLGRSWSLFLWSLTRPSVFFRYTESGHRWQRDQRRTPCPPRHLSEAGEAGLTTTGHATFVTRIRGSWLGLPTVKLLLSSRLSLRRRHLFLLHLLNTVNSVYYFTPLFPCPKLVCGAQSSSGPGAGSNRRPGEALREAAFRWKRSLRRVRSQRERKQNGDEETVGMCSVRTQSGGASVPRAAGQA